MYKNLPRMIEGNREVSPLIRNLFVLVIACLATGTISRAALAQRFVIGDEVVPKTEGLAWTLATNSGEDIELWPNTMWLPWKVTRIEGSRTYFRMDGKDVYCAARKVVPLDEAETFYRNQMESNADDPWLNKALGQVFVLQGEHAAAIKQLERAFQMAPEDYSIKSWMGRAYSMVEDRENAESCFRMVAGQKKYESEMRLYRAFSFFSINDWERTLKELDKSGLKTTFALRLRTDCYMALEKYDQALEVLDEWMLMDELGALPYYKRGVYRYRTGEYELALADTSLSLRLDEKNVNALLLRGATLARLSRHQLAIMDFDDALKIEPERPGVIQRRYESLAELERYAEAIEGATQRLKLDDRFDWGYFQRSVFHSELDQIPEAIADVSKAIEIDPNYPDYHVQRAKYYARNRQTKECLEDHDRAIQLEPGNSQYYFERGRARIRLGRFESGLADMDKAAEEMPDSLGLFYIRGTAYRDLGNYDLALADLKKCVEIDKTNPYVMREYAWLLATHPHPDQREAGRALRWIKRAMDEQVVAEFQGKGTEWTIPEFHSIHAAALAANQKFEEAVAAQRKAIQYLEDEDEKPGYEQRLKLYEGRKAYFYDSRPWFEDY